jgi:hypothetical protein
MIVAARPHSVRPEGFALVVDVVVLKDVLDGGSCTLLHSTCAQTYGAIV